MANLQWEVETTIGATNYGAILMRIAPIQGEYGDIAFGIIAPDGTILKEINPLFATDPATYRDVQFFESLVPPVVVTQIPLDSLGGFMQGVYTLSCHYIFVDQASVPTQSALRTVTFTLSRTSTATTANGGSLVTATDWNAGTVTFVDNSVYTGLATASRLISTTGSSGTINTTALQQTLPILAYVSTLTANVFRQSNLLSDVSVVDYFTMSAIVTTTAEYANYKTVADKAIAYLQGECSCIQSKKTNCVMRYLQLLDLQKSLNYDMTATLMKLTNLLG